MRRFIIRGAIALVAVLAVIYLGDTVILHFRSEPNSTVTVQHYYLIRQKNNRFETKFDRSYDQPCVNALFPHAGNPPCWYLRRHTEQQTEI